MTRLDRRRSGRHRRVDLPMMLEALDEVVEALDGRAAPKLLARARTVAERAGERLHVSGEHTVVALAGSTGSGKSSLFNAMSGADLSPVGVRRPTTSKAHACVWGAEGAAPLVQWLGVPRRQTAWQHGAVVEDQPDLDGLVLLDLPDHDSIELDHRLEVDRLVELVDLLVWVVDPQKYADEQVHERYLRRLAGHADVTVVLLNQIDTLNPFAAAECANDLRRLVALDGLRRAHVLTASARTGAGLDDVRALFASAVTRRQASNDRLVADVESVIYALAPAVSLDAKPEVSAGRAELVDALCSAAGVPVIAAAAEQSWRRHAETTLGWPVLRWVQALRPDPIRRLQLGSAERREVRSMVALSSRSSVPESAPVQQAQVESAVRRISDSAASELPPRWQRAVRRAAGAQSKDLRDALDLAVVRVDLGADQTPLWWRVGSVVQWVSALATVGGALWLLLLGLGSALGWSDPWTVSWPGVALPAALLVVGMLVGLLLAHLGRSAGAADAVLRRSLAESRLRSGVEAVADRLVIAPIGAELERHERARAALSRASRE
jgi:GTP-binding protein EngB required for normal cell division